MSKKKRYSELKNLKTFKERFEYLKIDGSVGEETFGYDRYLNQMLYKLPEWKKVRQEVIFRDNGCDLGIEGRPIHKRAIVHHINPINAEMIVNRDPSLFDSNNLITTSHDTHNAIHYGIEEAVDKEPITRFKNDTTPWKKQ